MHPTKDHGHEEASELAASVRLPNFLIIGAAKSGSTSLFRYLCNHPKIARPRRKEPGFFAEDDRYAKGLAAYSELFTNAQPDQLCFEASTQYTRWPELPEAPQRIRAAMPNVKLIYLMRHPVDRAYSHFVHRYTKELYPGEPFRWDFEHHVENDPMCLHGSLYMRQIERYLEHFPREAILPILLDDLKEHPQQVLQEVCRFLGLDYHSAMETEERFNDSQVMNALRVRTAMANSVRRVPGIGTLFDYVPRTLRRATANWLVDRPVGKRYRQQYLPPPMTPAVRRKFLDYFASTVDDVEQWLGRNLNHWRR